MEVAANFCYASLYSRTVRRLDQPARYMVFGPSRPRSPGWCTLIGYERTGPSSLSTSHGSASVWARSEHGWIT